MRVISGTARGRALMSVPGQGTRPTSDKVKEAIFSRIGPYFQGGNVLDLFAGTGALSIEALSRGMEHAVLIDADRNSIRVIRENLVRTGLEGQAEVYRNEASRAIEVLSRREDFAFDLVFLDPPYKLRNADNLMMALVESSLLQPQADLVMEHDKICTYPQQIGSVYCLKQAEYGDTMISYYRYDPK